MVDLSIVIPVKNEEAYLEECLQSLFASIKLAGISSEVLIIDNGSTDRTIDIANRQGCIVIVQPTGTIASLRNTGANNSKGQFLAFLDADCVVAPRWVEVCLSNLAMQNIAAVGTPAIPSKERATWVSWAWYELAAGSKRGDYVNWLGTSNLMLRRNIFLALGGFNEELETAEDVDLCLRLLQLNGSYRIRLEKNIHTLHLREVTSLRQLFHKEVWRGQSSLACFVKNGCRPKDLPSIFIPFINNILIVLAVVFLFKDLFISAEISLLIISLPAILMKKKGARLFPITKATKTYVAAFTFISARSIAVLRELFQLGTNFMKLLI